MSFQNSVQNNFPSTSSFQILFNFSHLKGRTFDDLSAEEIENII